MSVPLHERNLPIEGLLVMILLVTNKGKEYHCAPLCTCNWKRFNTTARPSAQDTVKTASKRFWTLACF